MSIASVTGFFVASLVSVAVAVGVLAVAVGVSTFQYFSENRRVRIARHESFVPYYRHRLAGALG